MARTGAKIDGKGTSRRKKSRPAGSGRTDLIRQLWEAAVNLRGAIEPADYKRYVLPIIFLRFLSLRYERRRRELERMVKEPDSEYYTKSAKQAAAILEDPDEYRAVGAFILPKPARWDEIVRHAQADDIKVRLDTALEALEKAYPDKLRGLLPRTYAGSNLARENVTGLINRTFDRRFLYAFMRSDGFTEQWQARKGETDMADYVSLTAQREFRVPIPSIEEQETIGSVLGGLDDKIELNRRMNQTLEAMVQALFRSWFVDFDPVSAGTIGRQPFGITGEAPASRSDRFEGSPTGPIPRGWIAGSIADLGRYVNGRNFTQGATGTGRMVIRIAELKSGPSLSTVYTDGDAPPEHVARAGDVLFAWSGSLGVYRWLHDDALINQHIFKVISGSLPQWFVHLHLLEALPFFKAIAADKATTMGHIKREHLSQWGVAIPPSGILKSADRLIGPLYEGVLGNARESEVLASLRDVLHPKLLSGEIRVREVGKAVERVGA